MNEEPKRRPAQGPRVAIAQIAPTLADVAANLEAHRKAVASARQTNATIVVFPELSLTGCSLKGSVAEVALRRDDPIIAEIAAMASDLALLVGFVEESREHHFYNAAGWFEAGRLVWLHRKAYLSTDAARDERYGFARGHRIRAYETCGGRAAALVCDDLLHPTAVAVAALDGAETIYVPAARSTRSDSSAEDIGAEGRHWENYAQAMARSLGVFIVFANRVGVEQGQTFAGGSEIVGPDGSVLAKAAYHEEDLVSAVLPVGATRRRRMQAPILREEDLDLTINELSRIRERPGQPSHQRSSQGSRDRGSWRDDRRQSFDDRRRDRRDSGGYDRSFDKGRRFSEDRRGRGQSRLPEGNRDRDFRRRDDRRFEDRRFERDQPQRGSGRDEVGGYGPGRRGKGFADERRRFDTDDRHAPRRRERDQAPARYRPERNERKPRALGGPSSQQGDEDGGSDDDS